jgi:gliding motility-associated lipoprotein GldH
MKKLLIFILLGTLLSCESNRIYEQNNVLDSRQWPANAPEIFAFEVTDNSQSYNIYFNIRNSLDYPFSRFFVEYTLTDSAGTELKKNLTSQYLFEQKTGKPFGNSAIGDVFDHQFKIIENYKFPYNGNYQISLKQLNRADTLKGVISVGVRVETVLPE